MDPVEEFCQENDADTDEAGPEQKAVPEGLRDQAADDQKEKEDGAVDEVYRSGGRWHGNDREDGQEDDQGRADTACDQEEDPVMEEEPGDTEDGGDGDEDPQEIGEGILFLLLFHTTLLQSVHS